MDTHVHVSTGLGVDGSDVSVMERCFGDSARRLRYGALGRWWESKSKSYLKINKRTEAF
jgi:hypothetical protein